MLKTIQPDELEALIQISNLINTNLDLDSVLESVMTVTSDMMKAEASSLFLIDEETNELTFHVVHGEKANKIRNCK